LSSDVPVDPGDLGRRIKSRREELGLTREQVAERAGMAAAYLEYVEEQPAQVSVEALWRLADALSFTPRELLGGGVDLPSGRGLPTAPPQLLGLDEEECRRLLSPGGVGRVAFTTPEGPAVVPVNFAMVEGTVVFRTAPGSMIADQDAAEIGFEVDHVDDAVRSGWSVLVVGKARRVRDPNEEALLRDHARIEPWAGGRREVYMQITPHRITGRRISA
jgi:transcriptional regulator with XRE-family HTH domain